MNKKITLLILMLFLLISSNIFSQSNKAIRMDAPIIQKEAPKQTLEEYKQELKDWFNSGDLIVELIIPEENIKFVNTKGDYGYFCAKAKINRVLKGNIEGYINININNPRNNLNVINSEETGDYSKILGNRCIVRIKPSTLPVGFDDTNNKGVYVTEGKIYRLDDMGDQRRNNKFYEMLHECCNVSLTEKKSPVNNNHTYKQANPIQLVNAIACSELFISEYLDGVGSNNAVEIYNPTDSIINLSPYKILLYHGASLTPTTIALTGTISAFGTHVVAQQGANSSITSHANQTTNQLNLNGSVTTVLNKDSIHIDKIGEIGISSSGNWTLTPTGGTNNTDIRRKYTVTAGETNWANCNSEWDVFSEDSVSNLGSHINLCTTLPDPNMYYAIKNVHTTNSYLDFDVVGLSNASTNVYLVTAPVEFSYDTTVFGANIVANGGITITNGSSFQAPNYQPANAVNTLHDKGELEFEVAVDADLSGAVTLTEIPTDGSTIQLFHVKMKVKDCFPASSVSIVHLDSLRGGSYYYNSPSFNFQTDNPFVWDNVVAYFGYTTANTNPCYIAVTLATSLGANGGVADVPPPPPGSTNSSQIMIEGVGFGNIKGKVFLTAADNNYPTHQYIKLDAYDIVGWSDSIIYVNVPSGLFSNNPSPTRYPASGSAYVKNYFSETDSAFTIGDVFVNYSVQNYINGTYKARLGFTYHNVIDTNGHADTSAYKFRFDSNTIGNPSVSSPYARDLVKTAIQDWACKIGIRYRILKDTSIVNGDTIQDGISYISMNPYVDALGFIGNTRTYPLLCGNNFYVAEADVTFSPNSLANWYYVDPDSANLATATPSDSRNDFFTVALHEIGHASLLRHVNVQSDLMYYAPTAGYPRGSIGTEDQDGGLDNVAYSKTKDYHLITGSCAYSPINIPANGSGSCVNPYVGIEKIGDTKFQLSVYPNPASNLLNVTFTKDKATANTIKLTNMLGQPVYYTKLAKNEGANEVINIGELAKGVYILTVTDDDNSLTQKIIIE